MIHGNLEPVLVVNVPRKLLRTSRATHARGDTTRSADVFPSAAGHKSPARFSPPGCDCERQISKIVILFVEQTNTSTIAANGRCSNLGPSVVHDARTWLTNFELGRCRPQQPNSVLPRHATGQSIDRIHNVGPGMCAVNGERSTGLAVTSTRFPGLSFSVTSLAS